MSPLSRRVTVPGAVVILAIILFFTLTPAPGPQPDLDFWCIACGQLGAVDAAANVILFVPLGFALAVAMNRRWLPIAICVATTVMIETLQISVIAGRDASFGDILANSLGGLLGVELALRRKALLWPEPRTATRLALAGCAAFALVCAATTWALGPAFVPRSLWIQWLPPRGGYDPFSGRLLAFDINGIDLPLGFPKASLGVDRRLMSDAWRATATIDRDGVVPQRSVLVRISEEITQPFALEQLYWDLTCLQKARSSELRFRSPRVGLRNAFQLSTGTTPDIVRLTCEHRDHALVARVQAGAESREEVVPLSPSLGWTLISPFDIPLRSGTRWIGVLWVIGLLSPVGYWWAAAVQRSSTSRTARAPSPIIGAAVLIALALGFAVAPLVGNTAVGAWWEWVAGLAGVAGGLLVGRLARRSLAHAREDAAAPTRAAFAQQ